MNKFFYAPPWIKEITVLRDVGEDIVLTKDRGWWVDSDGDNYLDGIADMWEDASYVVTFEDDGMWMLVRRVGDSIRAFVTQFHRGSPIVYRVWTGKATESNFQGLLSVDGGAFPVGERPTSDPLHIDGGLKVEEPGTLESANAAYDRYWRSKHQSDCSAQIAELRERVARLEAVAG